MYIYMDMGELQKDESVVPPSPSAPPPTPLACNSDDDHEYPPITTTTGIPVMVIASSSSTHPNPISTSTHPHAPVAWSTGLCACCEDVSSCCFTCWCPCITFGRIAEIVDRGSSSCGVSGSVYSLMMCVMGCSCLYSCFYRTKLRGQYFLEESPACCTDCCVHFCCEECALCQEYRQLQNQGFDMSIGWHGNVERQKRLAAMPTQVQGGMTR